MPVLIYNQTTNHNFFSDFNKNINWLFILDDIELFDTNLLSNILEYIVEYKKSKLIITSQNNLERTLPELNFLTIQDIFIKWNQNNLKELEKKYKKNNKINHIISNTIIEIVKNNAELSSREIGQKIMAKLESFTEGTTINDDITLIVLKRNNSRNFIEGI